MAQGERISRDVVDAFEGMSMAILSLHTSVNASLCTGAASDISPRSKNRRAVPSCWLQVRLR